MFLRIVDKISFKELNFCYLKMVSIDERAGFSSYQI